MAMSDLPYFYALSAEDRARLEAAGVDVDLQGCLDNNRQSGFDIADIREVLAVWEGQNEGDDWRWVLDLNDGRTVFLVGGCDFTGWDCQSYAAHVVVENPTPYTIASQEFDIVTTWTRTPSRTVYNSLLSQLLNGKRTTWRQTMDKEFGV
jgi:hypothetical protein